ncbi:MAG: hypothetical protein ABIY70_11520 [Capsulimonas sp.]|uniref:hypothetical protein n=1 Tax=Capsulimonas sp. TaxID=2494211 RepID=UPI003264DD15
MQITTATAIVLDTSPLGRLTKKRGAESTTEACRSWYIALTKAGCRFFVPEIADYELRREFLRSRNLNAIQRLDAFHSAEADRYLTLSTPDIRLAAQLWAQTRNKGNITAPPQALDADVLIAAQSLRLRPERFGLTNVIIATENVSHLATLASSAHWSDISA